MALLPRLIGVPRKLKICGVVFGGPQKLHNFWGKGANERCRNSYIVTLPERSLRRGGGAYFFSPGVPRKSSDLWGGFRDQT